MKKFLSLVAGAASLIVVNLARADVDVSPAGVWRTEGRAYHYRIARCGEFWCVFLAWAADNVLDTENPDPALRNRRIIGIRVVGDAIADGENRWKGTGYWYGNGNTYTGYVELIDKNTLRAWGCVGMACVNTNLYRLNPID